MSSIGLGPAQVRSRCGQLHNDSLMPRASWLGAVAAAAARCAARTRTDDESLCCCLLCHHRHPPAKGRLRPRKCSVPQMLVYHPRIYAFYTLLNKAEFLFRTFGVEPEYDTGAAHSIRDRPPTFGSSLWYVSQSLPSWPLTMLGAPGATTCGRAHGRRRCDTGCQSNAAIARATVMRQQRSR